MEQFGITLAHAAQSAFVLSVEDGPHSGSMWTWRDEPLVLDQGRTYMGFIQQGYATLICEQGEFTLREGMYWCVPGGFRLEGQGCGVVFGCPDGFRGMFSVGGPIEAQGRLRYIDGCTDSLLVHPCRLGDPCLNMLYLPPGTAQSAHTHPTLRFGIIAQGQGRCVTPSGEIMLSPGLTFCIPPEQEHSFFTPRDSGLWVIAYHPDTDAGPTDEDHPMLNRTFKV